MGFEYKQALTMVPELPMPKQLRRTVPACLAILVFLVFMSHSFGGFGPHLLSGRPPTHFPRKIWQTWKTNPLTFEGRDLDLARSWATINPDYRYEVLTDLNDVAYVARNFGPEGYDRPDIVYTYTTLKDHIIKADLLRYLIMFVEGGVYTDIDVEALRPVTRFIPERFHEEEVDMVVGIEIDEPDWAAHPILGSKCMSFCQWTFMCKPGLPVMMRLVDNILEWLRTVQEQEQVGLAEIKLDFDQVISGTGPSAFTKAILADLSERIGEEVTWSRFHAITESKLIGGLLVLPVEAFAAGQGHSDSGTHENKYALVRHHYHASHWPKEHPRYKHPFVGEVEDCNWKKECVEKWDMDKAWFDQLPKENQETELKVKQAADEAKLREEEKIKEADKLRDEERIKEETKVKEADRLREAEALVAAAKAKGLAISKTVDKAKEAARLKAVDGSVPNTAAVAVEDLKGQ